MYRNSEQIIDIGRMNFVLNQGALGDVITSLPAIIHARRHYHPSLKMRLWAPSWQQELLVHLLAPYGEFEVLHFEHFPLKKAARSGPEWDHESIAVNQMAYNTHTRNRVHMVDYAFNCLLDARPEDMAQRNYPTAAPLRERLVDGVKYIVFPVGATSENKMFRASVMVPIMEWAFENGYRPVIVGTKASHTKVETEGRMIPIAVIDETEKIPGDVLVDCIDMREKTTLLQLRDLCGHAAAVVGVDGGTLHLAGTTYVPIVYGVTTTLPKHRYIARNGDPSFNARYVGPRDLECAGCQANWIMSRQDFRFCAYGDSLCTERLHPEDFINGLKELGL